MNELEGATFELHRCKRDLERMKVCGNCEFYYVSMSDPGLVPGRCAKMPRDKVNRVYRHEHCKLYPPEWSFIGIH